MFTFFFFPINPKAIAEVLGSKASMSRDKYKTLQCLESAAVNSLISVDWAGTLLHILPMMQITFKVSSENVLLVNLLANHTVGSSQPVLFGAFYPLVRSYSFSRVLTYCNTLKMKCN